VAVKRQRVAHPAAPAAPGREYKDVMKEIMISAQLPPHPNICEFLGACLDAQDRSLVNTVHENVGGSNVEEIYALMSSGDASTLLPPRDLALSWCTQLAEGLACLHGRSPAVIHRDIKPSNLLITHDLQTLKICDFGLCTLQQIGHNAAFLSPPQRMTGGTGSYRYMAPEVLLDFGQYDTSVDIFSAASCIYLMTTGKTVMSEIEDPMLVAEAVSRNIRQPLDLLVDNPALAATISSAWDQDPAHRPVASDLATALRHHRALAQEPEPKRRGNSLRRAMAAVCDSIAAMRRPRPSKSSSIPASLQSSSSSATRSTSSSSIPGLARLTQKNTRGPGSGTARCRQSSAPREASSAQAPLPTDTSIPPSMMRPTQDPADAMAIAIAPVKDFKSGGQCQVRGTLRFVGFAAPVRRALVQPEGDGVTN
jgi:serine/threonine protein kinase